MVAALEGGNFKESTAIWHTISFIAAAFLLICCVVAHIVYKGIRKGPSVETNTKLSDVKGVDMPKAELEEIVDYLKDPEAIVGVGAQRVRDLFAAAKKRAHCIIFIDEIDAIGGKPNPNYQMYSKLTLYQMLVELDGLEQNEGIIVIGATNSHESIDEALLRHGRFDRRVDVPIPDRKGWLEIFEYHMSKVLTKDNVDLMTIARFTPGFSGADLANFYNIAALRATKYGAKAVSTHDLEFAREKNEGNSVVTSEELRKKIAYNESGHALVTIYTDGAYPVREATIDPHGLSLGRVSHLPPDNDRTSPSRKQTLAKLDFYMGVRVAEELIFRQSGVTAGASSDLLKATTLARKMVTKYGMSAEVGPVNLEKGRSMSSETRLLIEKEGKNLLEIERAYNNAKTILTTHQKELHVFAKALLKHQTLTGLRLEIYL
ncbi:putative peptidase M41, ATPase, AAA-type, core, P-loop containing nucleoside triphosphate hydrolase [Medicago truncatula]|uniref:Putative peptidase M41, ATPase, AAA-type, core, P-loop containing nucleoside triphosphate hydrolase n=1 Tax=Medicago truncatula TaxID=3880 RepID=A0A396HXN9_MEDTR|nr:putative peptidase M41, ATPase, AAA-type, core, P-loop containing nucleoside triphosphate hydrolase [Medicago truncatula]